MLFPMDDAIAHIAKTSCPAVMQSEEAKMLDVTSSKSNYNEQYKKSP